MSASMEREAELEDNLRQAYAFLTEEAGAPRVGVIGWCFGGGWSLRTALMLPGEIDAAVIYYGRLITDREQLKALDAPLLGIFGAEDGGIPIDGVKEFETALNELGKDSQILIYDGAEHAFANPSGTRYDAEAAEDAWAETLAFLEEHLEP
jgi:carboxymethylenebutenolidase